MAHLVISLQRGDLVANGQLRTLFLPIGKESPLVISD
jgi:hypothetical protein